jgi:RNA polymerase sigma-54 factor
MTGVDSAPTRDDLPDVTDFADYGGGGDGDWGGGGTNEDDDFAPQQVASSSLRDHLMEQLALLNLPLRDRQVVAALIDALDDDGYLTSSLEEIAEHVLRDDRARARGADHRPQVPAELRARGRGRAQCRRMPRAAARRRCPTTRRFAPSAEDRRRHLPLLAARDFTKLRRVLHCDERACAACAS